jgi:chaperonin GroES
MKKVKPLGNNVLVEVMKPEKVTESGIVIPDTAEERPQEGLVVAVGDGDKINKQLKEGAKVLFAKYSGTEIKIGGQENLILKAEDVLAVIE